MSHSLPSRRTRHGYVAVPRGPTQACGQPIMHGRLDVTPHWIVNCFMPAFARARASWGRHARAISCEIVSDLMPDMTLGDRQTGSEREFSRRVDLAVAASLNADGVPIRYPRPPVTPRPLEMPPGPPWYRALMTGWLQ